MAKVHHDVSVFAAKEAEEDESGKEDEKGKSGEEAKKKKPEEKKDFPTFREAIKKCKKLEGFFSFYVKSLIGVFSVVN